MFLIDPVNTVRFVGEQPEIESEEKNPFPAPYFCPLGIFNDRASLTWSSKRREKGDGVTICHTEKTQNSFHPYHNYVTFTM